jgi:hypothetical protein
MNARLAGKTWLRTLSYNGAWDRFRAEMDKKND